MRLSARLFLVSVLALATGSLLPEPAAAQDIDHARTVLARNPEAARAEATQLLESGTSSPEQLVAIHRVLGEAAARAGDEAAAVRSFTVLLALDPSFRMERTASDQVRSPYMEAAGFWSAHATRLAVDVAAGEGDTLSVRAVDPGGIAARVRVRARVAAGAWVELVRPTAAPFELPIRGLSTAGRVEYSVTLIDEMGNRLHQRGSDATPEVLTIEAPAPEVTRAPPPIVQPPPAADPLPFYVIAGAAGVVGLGAIIGGAVLHAERESLAGQWNGGDCAGVGVTRGEACASELARLRDAEVISGVLYGIGGAALLAAIVTVALAPSAGSPSSETDAVVQCVPGPGELGVACQLTF